MIPLIIHLPSFQWRHDVRSWSNSSSLPITSRLCQIICNFPRLNVQFVLVIAGYPDNLSRWNIHYPIWTMVVSQKFPIVSPLSSDDFSDKIHTVNGRNPAPVDRWLIHYLQGFNHPFGDAGFRNHPQYVYIYIHNYIYTLWLYTIKTYIQIYIYIHNYIYTI